jgi:threonine/homoserine/homoserine lactone efflux protein
MDAQLLAFLGISAVVIVTPGQDTALTIRNTLLGGRAAGVATALGVAFGQATWTIGASLGLTAILLASELAFTTVRLVGAGYLVFLRTSSRACCPSSSPRARPRWDRCWASGCSSSR